MRLAAARPIDPPLARVGMSEEEARTNGVDVRVAKRPMKAVLRTRTTSESAGFMKALVDANDHILDFAMIGSEAGEVMAVVQTAIVGAFPVRRSGTPSSPIRQWRKV